MKNTVKKLTKLQEKRKSKKITCEEMAKMLLISKSYYWQLENGQRRLSYELAKKIANILNTKPDDLFYNDI